jgi:signal recognition particle receptor subunit beta
MSTLVSPTHMRRIVVLGSDDVGKTTFLEKIGAEGSIKTTKTTSDGAEEEVEEKYLTFSTDCGHQEVVFSFTEITADFFKTFDHENSRILPVAFKDIDGALILFSCTDISSRAPIRGWLKLFKTYFPSVSIVVAGSKGLQDVDGNPPASFPFYEKEVIKYDVDEAFDLSPLLSIDRVRRSLAQCLLNDCGIKILLSVPFTRGIAILAPANANSNLLLKPLVLYKGGESVVFGRMDVHTGVFNTADQRQLISSIPRMHAKVAFMMDGSVSVTRVGSRNIVLDHGSAADNRVVLEVKNDSSFMVPNGRLHLSDATDAITYELKTFDSYLDEFGHQASPLSMHGLLKKVTEYHQTEIKYLSSKLRKYINYSEAPKEGEEEEDDELDHALGGEMNRLGLAHAVSSEDGNDNYDEECYYGNTQAY